MSLFIFLVVVIFCAYEVRGDVTCIGEDGKPVDMFIMYKLPRSAAKPGSRFLYLDSNSLKFRSSKHHVSSTTSPIGRTLQQIYKEYKTNNGAGSNKLAHIFYNDAPTNMKQYDRSYGHTKGQLAFDETSGFWVIQNVPKFPTPAAQGYKYPKTGFKYGQMMICVSFKTTSFKEIGMQLSYTKPNIYDSNLPAQWQETYSEIHDIIQGKFSESKSSTSRLAQLISLNGEKYLHFGKNAKFGHDLYHTFVATELKVNLNVATWQHGKKNLGPSCKGTYRVTDIRKVKIDVPTRSPISFLNLEDHSKYVISEKNDKPYVCVGDINRQYSQFSRGGGCICIKNLQLWEQFHSMIDTVDECK